MKKALVFAALLVPTLALAEAKEWTMDPMHSHASFTVRHMIVTNVRGEFRKMTGTVKLDEKDITKSSVEAVIDAGSIDTRVEKRDADLRSANFFDVEKFPNITFKSTKVAKAGKGKLKVTGNLTMHGVTKPVVLHVMGPTAAIHDPWGNARRGISIHTTINRRDWGLNWAKKIPAGAVVGDMVKVEIEGELVRPLEEKSAMHK